MAGEDELRRTKVNGVHLLAEDPVGLDHLRNSLISVISFGNSSLVVSGRGAYLGWIEAGHLDDVVSMRVQRSLPVVDESAFPRTGSRV
jgi:hypothetical protein